MKIYKKILLGLFLFIIILFMKNNVFGANFSYLEPPEQVMTYFYNTDEYSNIDNYDYFIFKNSDGNFCIVFLSKLDNLKAHLIVNSSIRTDLKFNNGFTYKLYKLNTNYTYNSTMSNSSYTSSIWAMYNHSNSVYWFSSFSLYNDSTYNTIVYDSYKEQYIFPYIADTDEVLSDLDTIDDILVFPGSLSKSCLPLKLSIYKYNEDTTIEGVIEIALDTNSPYYLYIVENPNDYWWEIPTELFKNSLQNGQEYHFVLLGSNEYDDFSISRSVIYQGTTYVPPTDEQLQTDAIKDQTQKIEEQTDAIKVQTEKIEEQTEVSKNIFQRIGDILSYINPLSENFFAYKLIDLLVDALKSLFVPEERLFRYLF